VLFPLDDVKMKISNTISESAFLVNESRARRVDISHDIYASLWTTDSTRDLWEDFKTKVYPYDDIELSLRNRFFLDNLNSFIRTAHKPIFINIGAGFTSYPFLIDKPCKCIEIDMAHVIEFKQKKIQMLKKDNLLPNCDVEFIAVDLSKKNDVKYLQDELCPLINKNNSFILLEGITYFLDKPVFECLLDMFVTIQTSGSHLACDFWDPLIVTNPVFKRLIKYFEKRFGYKKTEYSLFDVDYFTSILGYNISERTNIQQLEKKYLNTNILQDYEKILPENYIVLRRDESN
jgi:O-methyltransferase involved in polyketide biosynthesis